MSLLVPTVLVGILVLALVPFWGLKALYLGLLETFAFLYAGIYGWIYSRMRRLWERLPLGAVETVEVLIAQQTLQTPGLAVLTQDRLELIGLMGAPLTIPLKEIVGVREIRWLLGRRLWWKMGLVLERANGPSIALAFPEPIGRRWKHLLQSQGRSSEATVGASADNAVKQDRSESWKPGKWLWFMRVTAAMLLVAAITIGAPLLLAKYFSDRNRQPAEAGSTNSTSFGPVIERVVEPCASPGFPALDLDTGKVVPSGDAMPDMESPVMEAWRQKTGADIVVVPLPNNSWQIRHFLALVQISSRKWDDAELSPLQVKSFVVEVQVREPGRSGGRGSAAGMPGKP
jgi:hypothetical protein